jgi:hypothetical protein
MAVKTGVHHRTLPLLDSCLPEDDAAYGDDDEPSSSSDDESDYSDDEEDFQDGYSTPVTEPESDVESHPKASQRPQKSPVSASNRSQVPAISSRLPKYRDEPDDDTDEDIANVPLDYGRSGKTKIKGARIEERWHK